jgi:Protein of unknown function (DUF3179)
LTSLEPSVNPPRRTWIRFFYGIVATATCALFLIPAFIIRPFSFQSPRGLMVAIAVKQWAPLGAAVGFAVCAVLFLLIWPTTRKWSGIALGVSLLLVAACAAMTRVNYFEWMFHPVHQPGFEPSSKTKLDSGEMVLALNFNGDARAYPVREMAYHHIVNDEVGGVPVAVTY